MNAEIIAIGSELLLGQIIDTNSATIAEFLARNGIELVRTTAVGDDFSRITGLLREAIERSKIIITTGGLGPTEDDLTREAVSEVTGRPLVLDAHLLQLIEEHFRRRGYRMTENNKKQAAIPEGAIPIENPKGTAPAFIVDGQRYVIMCLPGVPTEMKYLLETRMIPFLKERFHLEGHTILYRVLRLCGLGESAIGLQIADLMRESKNPVVGTLASPGDIKIRITARAENPEEANRLIVGMEEEIRRRLGDLIYGVDEETLHGNLAKRLRAAGLSLSVIETLTGGLICQKLTSDGDSSFLKGAVLPSVASQMQFLEISPLEFEVLQTTPRRVAQVLAQKGRIFFSTDLGMGLYFEGLERTENQDYRTEVYFSLSMRDGFEDQRYVLGGDFAMIRERASVIAIDMVRKYLLKMGEPRTH